MRITEHNYLEQLNAGNEAALEYVMKHYGGLVKAVVHRHLYNLSQYEEDCINDVFYAVWTHISHYQANRNTFANWIAGIARLKALDYVRHYANKMQEVHLDEPMLESLPGKQDEYESLKEEISKEMEQMLSCLKEKDRMLFYRLYVEEIEEAMGMNRSVVYNRVSRAKKKLRKKYGRA